MTDVPKILNSPAGNTTGYRWLRRVVFSLSIALACSAIWILVAELVRPAPIAFPTNPDASSDPAADRVAAHRAAEAGIVRGDLWAEDALTYSDIFRHEDGKVADFYKNSGAIQQAYRATERALALAPGDARIWLLLSGLRSRFDSAKANASSAMLMSFYTGRNETELLPVRLLLALSLPSISDKDFQQLVSHDLRLIITQHAELKPAILTAYQLALPEGQQFLRDTLKGLDPTFLTKLPQK